MKKFPAVPCWLESTTPENGTDGDDAAVEDLVATTPCERPNKMSLFFKEMCFKPINVKLGKSIIS